MSAERYSSEGGNLMNRAHEFLLSCQQSCSEQPLEKLFGMNQLLKTRFLSVDDGGRKLTRYDLEEQAMSQVVSEGNSRSELHLRAFSFFFQVFSKRVFLLRLQSLHIQVYLDIINVILFSYICVDCSNIQ